MLRYTKRHVSIGELWFDEEPSGDRVDVLQYHQRSQPVPNASCSDFWSLEVDLTVDEEALFAGFKKEARYEARRAREKDLLVFDARDGSDPASFAGFCDYLDRFLRGKGMEPVDRTRLALFARAARLSLTRARSQANEDLVWHAYLLCGDRVRLLHSASLFRESGDGGFRSLVGRANRFLHWQDLLHFKTQGCLLCDFGGWYAGQTDQDRLRINKFKEEFGGRKVQQYDCSLGVSIKGKLALVVKRLVAGRKPRNATVAGPC